MNEVDAEMGIVPSFSIKNRFAPTSFSWFFCIGIEITYSPYLRFLRVFPGPRKIDAGANYQRVLSYRVQVGG